MFSLMTATAHLTSIADVFESLAASPSAVIDLRAYLAAPGPDTADRLAWTLNGLMSSHHPAHAGGPSIGPLQAAVTVLRHEVDRLPPAQFPHSQAAKDLVYLLSGLASVRLDGGTPEAAVRAADEAIARLTTITRGQTPPPLEDMDLLGDLLALRSTAKQSIVIGRPNESAAPVASSR